MTKRVLVVGLAVLVAVALGAYLSRLDSTLTGAPTQDEMATSIGTDVMRHLHRGHVPGRSAEIMLVPKPHHYLIGGWDLETLGSDSPTLDTSHPNPWSYLARVPIIIYGEGAGAGREVEQPVDISQLAPSYARRIGFAMDGTSAPLPGFEKPDPTPPAVIVTIVIDGGGWNTLQLHPEAWPNIARLARKGTTFVNATIGSAPSITGALHATFGTGVYPVTHGIPGNQMRGPDGANVDTWLQNADPSYLKAPTLADLWDVANRNKAVIATVSYEGWHLGMIGQGANYEGGDKDIAALWSTEENAWWINEDFYTLPDYLSGGADLRTLQRYEMLLDERDGIKDGTWFGHAPSEITEVHPERGAVNRPAAPSFVRYTGDAVIEILDEEPFGADDITDFYWIEMKMPDYAGHEWNVIGPEQEDVLAETDAQIGRLLRGVEQKVGKGNYLFAISADHGQQPLPDLHGGWRINSDEFASDIEDRFGNIVEKVTPVDVYLDMDVITREGLAIDDIVRWISVYTIEENIPEDQPANRVPPARLDDQVFAGAFSTDFLANLSDDEIESFGEGDYAQGNLTSTPEETAGN